MISIYSDGSSNGRSDSPCGWAFVILKDGRPVATGYGSIQSGTNNVAELEGAIRGLKTFFKLGFSAPLELVCDSQLVLGFATGAYKPTKNLDQVKTLQDLVVASGCKRFRWVKGHDLDQWNQRCDSLAKRGKDLAKKLCESPGSVTGDGNPLGGVDSQ